ncbi:MAG: cupredoxin domain-containing protein [Actinomycetota bacterium]
MATDPSRSRWLSLLRGAIYALIFVPIFITAISQSVIPPLLVFLVLFVVGLFVLGRNERNGTIMLGVLALLFFATSVPFIVDGLSHPDSWSDFIPNAIGVLGALTALVAATVLLRKKGTVGAASAFGRAVVAVGLVAIVVSVVSSLGVDSDTPQEGDVRVAAEDIEWDPETLTAEGGGAIFVDNQDLTRHTFTIDELDIDEELAAGQNVRVELSADPGEYRFYCEVSGHEDMEGTLTVE